MPIRPKKPCRKAGCKALIYDDYCPEHKQQYERDRGNSSQRGYGGRWKKARRAFLANHPLCRKCHEEGKVTAATEVDHIVPHKGDLALFWNVSNWQPLCKSCHSEKTAKEDGRWAL